MCKLVVAFLGINQFSWVGLRFVRWFYYGNTQRLIESGFMEKPGIEPANFGLPGIGLSPTPTFCGFSMGSNQYWAGWVYDKCVYYMTGAPEGSPKVVLVLKRVKRRGNGFKSHPTDEKKPGIEPATPGLQGTGLSPTPRRLLSQIKNFLWLFHG